MSSRFDRYQSQSQNPPPKKSKTEKGNKTDNSRGNGKKNQVAAAEGVTLPPPTLTSTPPRASIPSSQPPEQGENFADQSSRVWTNLIRLGADVLPGASIINGNLDAVEYASRIAPPANVNYLAAMDVNLLQEQYLRHIFEAMQEGQVIHAHHRRVADALFEDNKGLIEDNKRLKGLLLAREGSLSTMEGELGVLRKDREALTVALKKEQEDHEKARAIHAAALSEAEKIYKHSTKYKEDVMSYMSNTEAVCEFLKTKAGREAVEAEAQIAFEVGMYTKQQQIFPVLREKVSSFDPVAMGLPVIEENPDPDAENGAVDGVTAEKDATRKCSPIADLLHIDTSNVLDVPLEQIFIEDITGDE
ncbi:PREDICTED: uncharacterized protein LOC109171117 [Ipomoea nil]|uniref:uncharacterized protein LOC109171117 n=1 Tax=Ipomoea nil TaxID=35883 RepID=UPI000901F065|nr:PREDICTED: uncharacterized protein LOC109171117 [Ipomoea nil]